MICIAENKIRFLAPSQELMDWCKGNLEIPNPEYAKKKRMGFWTGDTPQKVVLWEKVGDEIHVPYGCLEELQERFPDGMLNVWLETTGHLDYMNLYGNIPLYPYQVEASTKMLMHKCGILQAPAGSGKTQMGLSIIAALGKRALWLTHTKDLLKQSRDRALQYWDEGITGTITEGKVDIGTHVTFATIQTMAMLDLSQYRDVWDVVITDECHRVAGTPTAVTQFSKVLNSLRARHKYGLSATVHRSDGLIRCTYALIGRVVSEVPKEAVRKTVMNVTVRPVSTGTTLTRECLMPDGTVSHTRLITMLTQDADRTSLIASQIQEEAEGGHSCLVLSDRVRHLKKLQKTLPADLQRQSAVIDGTMSTGKKKAEREKAIEEMRTGDRKILFATYALAKEGLDIPRLDRLFLTTPHKDYAVITQSIGRVARVFDGKEDAVAYDYVDDIQSLVRAYKRRCTTYRKQECRIEEGA